MRQSVYIETTVVSYLTSRTSHNPVSAGHQAVTREWWDTRRPHFDCFTSQFVVDEASRGDARSAKRRLSALGLLVQLPVPESAEALARALVRWGRIPPRYIDDAYHIAVSASHGMHYLLTWNCRHMANAALRGGIERVCRGFGFEPPIICTPMDLMEK